MQKNMNQLFDETQEDLEKQAQQSKLSIQASAQRLVDIKQAHTHVRDTTKGGDTKASPDSIEIEQWDIDYEDN
jgi:hypothetical protein